MNAGADRTAELLAMWQRNEALGAGLATLDLSHPANARALALFESRRRILYVHLQARQREAARLDAMARASGL